MSDYAHPEQEDDMAKIMIRRYGLPLKSLEAPVVPAVGDTIDIGDNFSEMYRVTSRHLDLILGVWELDTETFKKEGR